MLLLNYRLLRTAIDRTIGVIVSSNLVECVKRANEDGEQSTEELVKEAVNLLVRSQIKRTMIGREGALSYLHRSF